MISVWITVIMKKTLSAGATARKNLAVLETHKPLTRKEAEEARVSLGKLHQRYAASWMKLALTQVINQ